MCSDINECSSGTATCHHTCTNTNGSFTCSCRGGYSLSSDNRTCLDIDECSSGTASCNHTCTNTQGSFICSCRSGYSLSSDGITCSDVNECISDTARCTHTCTNTQGSFKCSCRSGYRLSSDGRTCSDINECVFETHECEQICTNENGTYKCSCSPGYILDTDGRCVEDIKPTSMVWIVSMSTSGTLVAVCVAVIVFCAKRRCRSRVETRVENEPVYFESLRGTADQTYENTENPYNSLSVVAEKCDALDNCQENKKVSTSYTMENPIYINTKIMS
ncbi:fibulin-5-like [Mya arenaria]|uniref:fibulin-5-like n=1 Tax=Mya arenaria TaxID=6604 RepID=UPI0022E5487A|nr:fibulin-5-like [Mya arenaria]